MNITADLDIRYALPLCGYIMPFLVVVTIIANMLMVLVLPKKHMRTPTNLVLMAMNLRDMFTLLFPILWLLYTFGDHHRPLRSLYACYAYNYMKVPVLFQTASIWLTLARGGEGWAALHFREQGEMTARSGSHSASFSPF